ncbi:hypothetical protein QJS04_geneDACA009332 [Acorus gramineus]|uniref:MULE transposase domain-containing protein n=1 Tax=Acorus gramineus TaxID=55184 RepID=A0AAV9AH39_ACOGR|nr:hypothetical protein QJS04_geneDACA009332 [Acorus gramineus]
MNNVHSCGGGISTNGHPRASRRWVGEITRKKFIDSPLYRPRDIVKDVFRDYGINLPYHKAWHGKEIACKDLHGDEALSFDHLRWYATAVMNTNPGSYVELECTPEDHRFRRVFVSFGAVIAGFETGCRPMLFLDGTFLKSKYQGILLAIIAKNGNDGFFPLAFSVVDQETEDNWAWTLTCLRGIISSDRRITFISDRGKGLMSAVPSVFPDSYHSHCLRHLKMNFKETITGKFNISVRRKLLQLLDAAAYGLRIEDYRKVIAECGVFLNKLQSGLKILIQTIGQMPYFQGKDMENCTLTVLSLSSSLADKNLFP